MCKMAHLEYGQFGFVSAIRMKKGYQESYHYKNKVVSTRRMLVILAIIGNYWC